MQLGHPINFASGGYGFYPWMYIHHIAWKILYAPGTILGWDDILFTLVCPYIEYMVCPDNFVYNLSFDSYKTAPLVHKIDHVQPSVTDFFP